MDPPDTHTPVGIDNQPSDGSWLTTYSAAPSEPSENQDQLINLVARRAFTPFAARERLPREQFSDVAGVGLGVPVVGAEPTAALREVYPKGLTAARIDEVSQELERMRPQMPMWTITGAPASTHLPDVDPLHSYGPPGWRDTHVLTVAHMDRLEAEGVLSSREETRTYLNNEANTAAPSTVAFMADLNNFRPPSIADFMVDSSTDTDRPTIHTFSAADLQVPPDAGSTHMNNRWNTASNGTAAFIPGQPSNSISNVNLDDAVRDFVGWLQHDDPPRVINRLAPQGTVTPVMNRSNCKGQKQRGCRLVIPRLRGNGKRTKPTVRTRPVAYDVTSR